MDLVGLARELRQDYGQGKQMGPPAVAEDLPHFFLLRRFLGVIDLLVILNTKRCSYRCFFCQLPAKSSSGWIDADSVRTQFAHVLGETRHALSIVQRVTVSNEGSVLDEATLAADALGDIIESCGVFSNVTSISLETRLEYAQVSKLKKLARRAPRARLGVLTGFETLNADFRDRILGKRESLEVFLQGLDNVSRADCDLTAYVLYKPGLTQSDDEAYIEAEASIDFLVEQCAERGINLTIRLNPMYAASGSRWFRESERTPDYLPPRLSDVLALAKVKRLDGVRIYVGLSTEGLATSGTYRDRADFNKSLLKEAIVFNLEGPATIPGGTS